MTKLVTLTIYLICAFASTLHAQTINVRAGDHATFTRLVFYVDKSIIWNVNEETSEIDINFSNFAGKIDHSKVFEPISRNRISNISSQGNFIKLKISCTCNYRVSRVFSTYRYIDIISEPHVNEEFSNASDVIIAKAKKRSLIQRDEEKEKFSDVFSLPIYEGYSTFSNSSDRISSVSEIDTASENPNPWPEPVSGISRSLGQIISQGTLNHRTALSQTAQSKREETNLSNIITTDPNSFLNQSELSLPEFSCGSFENFSITDWKNSSNFNYDISQLRAQIFSEFDDIDALSVENLAKTYIYYSFGLEAYQVLSFLDDASSNYLILSELSMIVDGNFETAAPTVLKMRNCGDFFTLLNFLIEEDPQKFSEFEIDRALLSLNSLPLHLRTIFGLKFSLVLSESGDDASARSAIISVERGQPDNMSEINLTKSVLDQNSGNSETSIVTLKKLSNGHSRHSLKSAIELTKSLLEQGKEVPEQILDLLTAYAVEFRGSKIESQIHKSIILASSSIGDHHRAFNDLELFQEKFGNSSEYSALTDELLNRLINHRNEASFVSSVFQIFPNSNIKMSEEHLIALSSRIENYGFGEALKFLWPNSLALFNSPGVETSFSSQSKIEFSERELNSSEPAQDGEQSDDSGIDSDTLEPPVKPFDDLDSLLSESVIKTANELLLSSHATRKGVSENLF
ncbi:MAG: hypothetical protein ABJN14_15105 [Paracoccaceae bacterium]